MIFFHNFCGKSGNFVSGTLYRAAVGQLGVIPTLQPPINAKPIPGVADRDLLGDSSPQNARQIICPAEGTGNGQHTIADVPA